MAKRKDSMKAVSACLLVGVVLCSVVSAQTKPKQIDTMPVYIDYAPTPATLEELVQATKVVVFARVENTGRLEPRYGPENQRHLETEYELRLLDVLKTDDQNLVAGESLVVRRTGGELDEGDRVRRSIDPAFPLFRKGEEYILFLEKPANDSTYMVAYGPNGAFEVTADGTVRPRGRSLMAASQNHRSKDDVLDGIRRSSNRK
jgi:hypothetical protein